MNAREYLNQFITRDNEINKKLQRLETLREVAKSTAAPTGGERVQHSRQKNPLENIMVKIIDLDREIDKDIDELVDLKAELWELLDRMSDERYKRVLWLRYAERQSWTSVAAKTGVTKRHTMRLHILGVESFKKIYEKYKMSPPCHLDVTPASVL